MYNVRIMVKDDLRARQVKMKLSDSKFAELLGYKSRITWVRVKLGYAEPSPGFLLKAKRVFPDLEIFDYEKL